jgi:hypothetical protein
LADELAALCMVGREQTNRVMIDGADAAEPAVLGALLAARLRAGGRPCAELTMADWLRPASLRLEHGRADPNSYRDAWFDYASLSREVLDPFEPGGSGRWLPTLWDVETDRATRAERLQAEPGTVLVVAGPMLLGRGLPFDLTVHLHLSEAALRRRSAPELGWTVTALLEHERLAGSDLLADIVVRVDHAARPAISIPRDRGGFSGESAASQ